MQQQEDSKALLKQKEDSLQEARSMTEEQLRQQFLELTEVRVIVEESLPKMNVICTMVIHLSLFYSLKSACTCTHVWYIYQYCCLVVEY